MRYIMVLTLYLIASQGYAASIVEPMDEDPITAVGGLPDSFTKAELTALLEGDSVLHYGAIIWELQGGNCCRHVPGPIEHISKEASLAFIEDSNNVDCHIVDSLGDARQKTKHVPYIVTGTSTHHWMLTFQFKRKE